MNLGPQRKPVDRLSRRLNVSRYLTLPTLQNNPDLLVPPDRRAGRPLVRCVLHYVGTAPCCKHIVRRPRRGADVSPADKGVQVYLQEILLFSSPCVGLRRTFIGFSLTLFTFSSGGDGSPERKVDIFVSVCMSLCLKRLNCALSVGRLYCIFHSQVFLLSQSLNLVSS